MKLHVEEKVCVVYDLFKYFQYLQFTIHMLKHKMYNAIKSFFIECKYKLLSHCAKMNVFMLHFYFLLLRKHKDTHLAVEQCSLSVVDYLPIS